MHKENEYLLKNYEYLKECPSSGIKRLSAFIAEKKEKQLS